MKKILLSISGLALLSFSLGTWADTYYGRELCSYSEFQCVKMRPGQSWSRLFPDPDTRDMVMRLNRTDISTIRRPWIVIPKNPGSINLMELSPLPGHMNTGGAKMVFVNLSKQAWGAYDASGQQVRWGPVSSARGYCPDMHSKCTTPTGTFKIFYKEGPECVSTIFPLETHGGAPMPWCMHFFKAFALHGSYELPGYNASHGCVRMFPEDAQWLNQEFTDIGTKVVIVHD